MGKNNKVNTFNMVPKNDALKKFGKRLAEILGIIAALLLLLSISPKNAVRMTMVLGGVNPIRAIKSSPTYLASYSREMKMEVYALPSKQAYNYDVGEKIQYFKIHTFLVFHLATPTSLYY